MTNEEVKQLTGILAKIKTPKDIKALHDVRVMLDIIDCGNLLSTHLGSFKDEFVESFAMSADDVLSEIPEKKWKSYKFKSDYFKFYDYGVHVNFYSRREQRMAGIRKIISEDKSVETKYTIDMSKVEIEKEKARIKTEIESNIPGMCFVTEAADVSTYDADITQKLYFEFKLDNLPTLQDKLYHINKTDKCFYINHKKKTIEMNWALWTPILNKIRVPKGYNEYDVISQYEKRDGQEFKSGYIGLDNKSNIISYTASFNQRQQFYIGRDSDWYSKRRTHEYEMASIDLIATHKFCMNTNVYLGCELNEQKNNMYRRGSEFNLYQYGTYMNSYSDDKFDINELIEDFNDHLKRLAIVEDEYILEGTEKDREKRKMAEIESEYRRKYRY